MLLIGYLARNGLAYWGLICYNCNKEIDSATSNVLLLVMWQFWKEGICAKS